MRGSATLEAVIDQVRVAADAGFATAWSSQALGWDALTTVAVAGAAVAGIAVGTAVVPVPQRHPMVLAAQALTAQAAVAGRLTLGVGAGVGVMVSGMFGLPSDRPVRRMREYLTVLGPLLRGEGVDHRGQTLTAVGAVTVPGGVSPPSVLVAAMGPRMVRVAGELSDGTVTWMTGPKALGEHIVPAITKAAADAGRRAPRVVAGLPVCVTGTADDVRAGSPSISRSPHRFPSTARPWTGKERLDPRTSRSSAPKPAWRGRSPDSARPASPSSWPCPTGPPTNKTALSPCSRNWPTRTRQPAEL